MMAEGAEVQMAMFEAVLQLVAKAFLKSNWSQRQKRLAEQLASVVMCKCVDSHFSVTVE